MAWAKHLTHWWRIEMSAENEIKYFQVAGVDEIAPGERIFVDINNDPVVIFRVGDAFYAIKDMCTHDRGPLGDGDLDGFEVVCPRHGARFDIRTGKATRLPAVRDTVMYPVRVNDGQVEIGLAE